MKNNFLTISSLVVIFDILFYEQIPGINVLVFTLILTSYLLLQNPEFRTNRSWMLIMAAVWLTSVFVGIYGDFISSLAYVISFVLLASYSTKKDSSIWVALTGYGITYIKSPFIIIKNLQLQIEERQHNSNNKLVVRLGIIGLALIIVLIFFFIYRSSNILFYNFTQNINLNFISISLILFTLNAILIITAFYKYTPIKALQLFLDKSGKHIINNSIDSDREMGRISLEQFAGIVLLSSLNVLLLFVNIIDLEFLIKQTLPQGITYSKFIHQGVGMLIFSIVLAVLIILYFFRGELNYSNNKWFKILAYTWVGQNLFMIFSSFSRNYMYIEAYGLTEKRIGVYFYLLLAAIGLILTFVKVYKIQNNYYLIRLTTAVYFIILLFSCPINWDNIITHHNLSRQDVKKNIYYLNQLSYTNIPLLIDYAQKNKLDEEINIPLNNNIEKLHERILYYLHSYNEHSDWQSFVYSRNNVYQDIINKKIRLLNLNSISFNLFNSISLLPDIEDIKINNSNIDEQCEWYKLRNIKKLTLNYCQISDLTFLYHLNKLEYLDIKSNNIENLNYTPIYSLKNLKELHVSSINTEKLKVLKIMLPETKIYY